MINQKDIQSTLNCYNLSNGSAADALYRMFSNDLSKYTALVDAILEQYKLEGNTPFNPRVRKAFKSFIPKKTSEKLDELAEHHAFYNWDKELRQIADEVRELEK